MSIGPLPSSFLKVAKVQVTLESERRQRRELELQLDAAKTEADKIQRDSDDSKDKM